MRLVESETQADNDLIMSNLAISDVTSHFFDFEPVQVLNGFGSLGNGLSNGVVMAFTGRTGHFDNFINMITHRNFACI